MCNVNSKQIGFKVVVEWIGDDCYEGSLYSVKCGNCDCEFSDVLLWEPTEDEFELIRKVSELLPDDNFCKKCGKPIRWEA